MILKQILGCYSFSFNSLGNRNLVPVVPLRKFFERQRFFLRTSYSNMSVNVTAMQKADAPKMKQKVRVRYVDQDETMTISLLYKSKEFNLCRKPMEHLEISLGRLQQNLKKLTDKEFKKKVKKLKKSSGENVTQVDQADVGVSTPECYLVYEESKLPLDTPNKDAWMEKSFLHIGEQVYEIQVNEPTVLTLKLPLTCLFAGYPVFPKVEFEFAIREFCRFHWYKFVSQDKGTSASKKSGWYEFAEGEMLTPGSDEVGCKIKVVCTPSSGSREGQSMEAESAVPVSYGPEDIPFERRQSYTNSRCLGDVFRVVSYNILADVYADSDFSRDTLFPQCPSYALHFDYRSQLLLKEISGYNGDIVCLQEVDRKFFDRSLSSYLSTLGYEGHLCLKDGEVPEGEATFFRQDRYELIGEHNITMSEMLEKDENCRDLLEGVSRNQTLLQSLREKKSIAQVLVLKDQLNDGKIICVANTHLYFHPRAWHIRLIQTAVILRHMEQIKEQYSNSTNSDASVLICGDFNSAPHTGVHHFVLNGSHPASALDWFSEGKEQYCGGIDLSHQLNLASACSDVPYTNYVTTFIATLDYIFYSNASLTLNRVIPMPSHEDVIRYSCLPNQVFPSDHLPVICELKWVIDKK